MPDPRHPRVAEHNRAALARVAELHAPALARARALLDQIEATIADPTPAKVAALSDSAALDTIHAGLSSVLGAIQHTNAHSFKLLEWEAENEAAQRETAERGSAEKAAEKAVRDAERERLRALLGE